MNEQPNAPLLTPEQLELIAEPVVQSLLYDVNLLPESLLSLDRGPGHQHWGYLLSVLEHFKKVFEERDALIAILHKVYAASIDESGKDRFRPALMDKITAALAKHAPKVPTA